MPMEPRGSSTTASVIAPAKINLYLHVTGRRDDGYHLLDSLVAFTDIGDVLTLAPAAAFAFSVQGQFAGAFTPKEHDSSPDSSNLVVRAAWALSRAVVRPLQLRITLTKSLPLASGIGGGSANAAATLRALLSWWELSPDDVPDLRRLMSRLGADVPVCFSCQPQWAAGVGEILRPVSHLPDAPIVLVNPGKRCPTPKVFAGFNGNFAAHSGEQETIADFDGLISFLARRQNMLTAAAGRVVPEIAIECDALSDQPGCRLARMSGSGATCFGLFNTHEEAARAAKSIFAQNPHWWVRHCTLNGR